MEPPKQIDSQGGADYLDVLTKAAFQSGVSWAVVESKWDGFRTAFKEFDPEAVAGFDEREPVPEYNDWRRSRGLEPVEH